MTEVSALLLPPSTGRRENPEFEPTPGTPPFFATPPEVNPEEGRSFARTLGEELVDIMETGDLDQPDRLDPSIGPVTPEAPPSGQELLISTEIFPTNGKEVAARPEESGVVHPEIVLPDRPEEAGQRAATVDVNEPSLSPGIKVAEMSAVSSDAPLKQVEKQIEGIEDKTVIPINKLSSNPTLPPTAPVNLSVPAQNADRTERVYIQSESKTQTSAPVMGERSAEKPSLDHPPPDVRAQIVLPPQISSGPPVVLPTEAPSQTDSAPLPPALADLPVVRPSSELASVPSLQPVSGQSAPHPVQQILVAIERLQVGERISLRLDPPDLGTVSIRLEIVNGTITAIVAAERPDTVELLARHRHELGYLLAEAGFSDTETRIDLQNGDLANSRENLFADVGNEPDEVNITLAENADPPISLDFVQSRGINGRLDIRV